jgi:hypothetical protein
LEDTHIEVVASKQLLVSQKLQEADVGDVDLQFLAVISSPDEPYVGKMFNTIKEAGLCYNEYARKKGFSIRIGTSRRLAITKELDKVLFVCKKEDKGKKKQGS